MASGAFGSNVGMRFELRNASRVNSGLDNTMQELNIAAPEAVGMWPLIGDSVGKWRYSLSGHCLRAQLREQGLGIFKPRIAEHVYDCIGHRKRTEQNGSENWRLGACSASNNTR